MVMVCAWGNVLVVGRAFAGRRTRVAELIIYIAFFQKSTETALKKTVFTAILFSEIP